jgi:hypothetical protein
MGFQKLSVGVGAKARIVKKSSLAVYSPANAPVVAMV